MLRMAGKGSTELTVSSRAAVSAQNSSSSTHMTVSPPRGQGKVNNTVVYGEDNDLILNTDKTREIIIAIHHERD